MLQRSSARYVLALYVADIVLTLAALLLARWVRLVVPLGKPLRLDGADLYWPVFLLTAVIWSITLSAGKVYDPQRIARLEEELPLVIRAIAIATVVLAGALYFSYRGLSRLLYVYFFVFDIVLCVLARLVLRRLMDRRAQTRRRRVLIVGAGSAGQQVARALKPCGWMGVEVVGYLTEEPQLLGREVEGYRVLGTLAQAPEIIAQEQVQEVVLALPLAAQRELANVVAGLQELPVNIKVLPDYSDMVFVRATMERLGDLWLVGLKEPVIGPIDRLIKRALDVVLSALILVLLAPLMGVIALLVKWSSPGPVFYRSLRVGEGGRTFPMLKFRTMYQGADRREAELISETEDGKLLFNKRPDDPRVTPIGRFLRRYSLDELPQLYNVLKGEMSLVGPRPELPALVERYEPWQRKRFTVPQGITGWWQISGRGNKAKYLHTEDDLYYIQHYSLWLDLRILARTLSAVIRGEGAF
jgi:exopolysaccharide biosynthesis polyprenyl glycosylphosphotransferase